MRKLLILWLILGNAGILQAQVPDKGKLDQYFQALEDNDRFMGSISVSRNGKTIYSRTTGFADTEKKTKMDENTKFRIGSISKMFTAALVMKAVENNKVLLTSNLASFYPTIPNADKISIAQLLSHRSGIHNFTDDEDYTSWSYAPKTEVEMIELISKGKSEFEPDSKSDYSNSNYILLTVILQNIYKKSYAELLRDQIVKPLALKNTYFGGKIKADKNEATSYSFKGKWEKAIETDMSIPLGAGAIVSTPNDLSRFIEALFAGKLVSAASLDQMKNFKENYGFGMFKIPFNEKTAFGHTGGIDSFVSMLGYFPEDKVTLALTSNGTNYDNNEIAIAALNWVFGKPFDVPEFKNIILKSSDLDKYLGVYATTELPLKITVTKNDLTLVAQATGQSSFPMEATDKDIFEYKAAGVILAFNPSANQVTLKQSGRSFIFTKE